MKTTKNIVILITTLLILQCSKNILLPEFSNLNFRGSLETLDIATWNIEYFPKDDKTIMYVNDIIDSLNVDIIALQEINDVSSFLNLEMLLDETWEAKLVPGNSDYGKLAYLINTDAIIIDSVYNIPNTTLPCNAFVANIPTHVCYNNFPNGTYNMAYNFAYKMPYVLKFQYNNQPFVAINVHFKCCDYRGDEEIRRYEASQYLNSFIVENNYTDDNVIILGDFNDEISAQITIGNNNLYIFEPFLSNEEYIFADTEISMGPISEWSFPNFPSHIDHVVISNEIFNNVSIEYSVKTILVENILDGGWQEYDNYVSDHRPVLIKLYLNSQ